MVDTAPIIGTTMSRTIKESGAFGVLDGEGIVITEEEFWTAGWSNADVTVATVGCVVVRFPLIKPDARSTARVLFAWTAIRPGFPASAWS